MRAPRYGRKESFFTNLVEAQLRAALIRYTAYRGGVWHRAGELQEPRQGSATGSLGPSCSTLQAALSAMDEGAQLQEPR
jgi:hypothetical protein